VLVLATLAHGCVSSEDESRDVSGTEQALAADEDPATAKQRRHGEVNAWIDEWHAQEGHKVIGQEVESDGTVVDIVSADSIPGSRVRPASEPLTFDKLPEEGARPRLDRPVDPNVVRIVRPHFARYVEGLEKAATLREYVSKLEPGTPFPGSQRLYAGSRVAWDVRGAYSMVNAIWQGSNNPGSGEFFLAQTSVTDFGGAGGGDDEWVGWVIGRHPSVYDSNARLMTEFFTAGIGTTGNYAGGWAGSSGLSAGFVPYSGASVHVGDQVPGSVSVVDGAQYSHEMSIMWDPACGKTGCTGGWWLAFDGQWVGHYPIGTAANQSVPFDLINSQADEISFIGEVFDSTQGTWTATDMTSGIFPSTASSTAPWQKSGYYANMQIRKASDNTWYLVNPANVVNYGGDDANCYTRFAVSLAAPWNATTWFGGPGKTNANSCDPY
jgi:hypothetical protein